MSSEAFLMVYFCRSEICIYIIVNWACWRSMLHLLFRGFIVAVIIKPQLTINHQFPDTMGRSQPNQMPGNQSSEWSCVHEKSIALFVSVPLFYFFPQVAKVVSTYHIGPGCLPRTTLPSLKHWQHAFVINKGDLVERHGGQGWCKLDT